MTALTLSGIEFRLAEMRSRYQQARGQLDLLTQQRTKTAAELDRMRTDIENWRLVQALFTAVSESAREQLKVRLEETVTAALRAILERDDIRFEVAIREVGGRPAADWRVVSCYGDLEIGASPEEGRGGGVVDIVSLALRLSLLELSRPKPGGPIILDEPGKHVSAEYSANVATFLRRYAEQTGRQIILVTHNDALAVAGDVSYRVTMSDGKSEVRAA